MVTVDGGGGYWNPHPGDDPWRLIDELIPICQRVNLGLAPNRIGTMGISMGGYGALLLAEKYPRHHPPWRLHQPCDVDDLCEAQAANAGAYASAADFAEDDA